MPVASVATFSAMMLQLLAACESSRGSTRSGCRIETAIIGHNPATTILFLEKIKLSYDKNQPSAGFAGLCTRTARAELTRADEAAARRASPRSILVEHSR